MQRRICNAQNMAFRRATQTDDQRILRNAQVARQVAFRRSHESFDETEQRREASARYMATARSFLNNDEVNQIRIKETQNRLLKSNLMAETTNQETLRLIPRISEFVEVIQSTRDAFKHLMKTKVFSALFNIIMSIDSASSIISIPEGSLFVAVNAFQICELNKQKFTVYLFY